VQPPGSVFRHIVQLFSGSAFCKRSDYAFALTRAGTTLT
jgi:hypothetical protein